MLYLVVTMHIDDQTYQRNGKTYRRALLRNSYRKNGKVHHDTVANLSLCNEEEIEVMKFALILLCHIVGSKNLRVGPQPDRIARYPSGSYAVTGIWPPYKLI